MDKIPPAPQHDQKIKINKDNEIIFFKKVSLHVGMDMDTLLYLKWVTNKDLL